MVDVILYGQRDRLNNYFHRLEERLGGSVVVKSRTETDKNNCKVIISIKSDNLCSSMLMIDGFINIGIQAKNYLDPYLIEYSKIIGQSTISVRQRNVQQTDELGEYEDLESYDMRMGNAYVG